MKLKEAIETGDVEAVIRTAQYLKDDDILVKLAEVMGFDKVCYDFLIRIHELYQNEIKSEKVPENTGIPLGATVVVGWKIIDVMRMEV